MTAPFADITVVFDLDGTLVDSAPDLIRAANHAIGLEGLAPVDAAVIRPFVGVGAIAMIGAGLEATGATLPDARLDELRAAFLTYYEANIAVETRPYPGLIEALDEMAAGGAAFAVCTNKQEMLAHRLLEALGLTQRFAAIIGRDTLSVHKPDPAPVREAVARSQRPLARAVMVGDTSVDVRAAHGAGIPCIAVTFGYPDMEITQMGADAVISGYDELDQAVLTLTSPTRET